MAIEIKSKLLLEREKIEAIGSLGQVQEHKARVDPEKWNKFAYAEIMRLCDVRVQEFKSKG